MAVVKKIFSKLIKPLTPTPLKLKNYKISFTDRIQLPNNMAVLLFYKSKPETSRHFEESLAKTLVHFYPLAGRFIKQQNSVDCSDHGAEFIEAEAPTDLRSEIAADQHNHLLPDSFFHTDESAARPLLSIQSTRFSCGGAAVAVSVSHRIIDAASLAAFIAAWSNTATGRLVTPPSFDLPSLLPYDGYDFHDTNDWKKLSTAEEIVVKKIVFDGMTLARLRSRIGKPASAGRLASAVVAQALIRLGRADPRGFRIFQPVNMRVRNNTTLKNHVFGNFAFPSVSRRVDADASVGELVDLIGEAVRRSVIDHGGILCGNRDGRSIIMDNFKKFIEAGEDSKLLLFSDWSKFGFDKFDFGWGKPVSTSVAAESLMDCSAVITRDGEGDGIQAWLHLSKSKMSCFEQYGHFKRWDSWAQYFTHAFEHLTLLKREFVHTTQARFRYNLLPLINAQINNE